MVFLVAREGLAMSEPNGKATVALVFQVGAAVVTIIALVATPLILMYTKLNVMETKLQEIETQFKAADEFRNINLAGQMRLNSLIWQKVYDQAFPGDLYFPSISNRK